MRIHWALIRIQKKPVGGKLDKELDKDAALEFDKNLLKYIAVIRL